MGMTSLLAVWRGMRRPTRLLIGALLCGWTLTVGAAAQELRGETVEG